MSSKNSRPWYNAYLVITHTLYMHEQPQELDFTKVSHTFVSEGCQGQRIDNFLMGKYQKYGLVKSYLYKIIRKGEVRVNKGRIKPCYKLAKGDLVRIPPMRFLSINESEEGYKLSFAAATDILAKMTVLATANFLVLNKPAGLAVHGGTGIKTSLASIIHSANHGEVEHDLVHRLDRETSGCILISKNKLALRALNDLLKQHKFTKIYHALLMGHADEAVFEVDMPIGDSKASLTKYNLIQKFADSSLFEVEPVTGRTHQIRVHSLDIEMPIAGDSKYGDRDYNKYMRKCGLTRLFLHAAKLEFVCPITNEYIVARADYDKILESVLRDLK